MTSKPSSIEENKFNFIENALKETYKNLEKKKLTRDNIDQIKINSGIYIIYAKITSPKKVNISIPPKVINHPPLNHVNLKKHSEKVDKHVPVYVGKSLTSLTERIKQHFELDMESSTYSLKLDAWANKTFSDYEIKVIEIHNHDMKSSNYINLLENYIWEKEKPIFGKK